MLMRICLIVAIIGGLAVGGVNFFLIKKKVEATISQRDTEKRDKEAAQKLAADNKKGWDQTKATLDKTTAELNSTKQQRDQAVAKAD